MSEAAGQQSTARTTGTQLPGWIANPLGAIGAQTIGLARLGQELTSVFIRTLYYCFRGRREPGALIHYCYEIGNKSVFFVTVVMGFIGMIMVYQAGLQNLRILPDLSLMGATYTEFVVRDFAWTLSSLMLATRVGAGIAAEIGSMVVTEQVDALRMCAADPIDYLIKPRFIASLIMTMALCIWAGVVMFTTGLLTAWAMFDLNPNTFANLMLVDTTDLLTGVTKGITYGAAIPIVAGHAGLTTYGGSEGVGLATTQAVVNCCLAVIILNLIISAGSFLIFGA